MAHIQSPTAEIRRGKKERKIEITGQKYNGLPYYIGATIINRTVIEVGWKIRGKYSDPRVAVSHMLL